ncbi:molybdopterin converting factor subunit 1 [Persephonella sp.]|uniref:molybdopterin converting factor subunit 1 n=1 Tax=Persephonella sp. TaxID=2060922 RepID=UPI0025E45ADF|nr:molybdopterin converting factor subunit 1 [Persephonella sp.]
MKVKVLYFSSIKDRLKKNNEFFEIEENSTVSDLIKEIQKKYPDLSENLKNIMIAVNEEYADIQKKLKNGDTVALIPPVSGG